MPKSSEPVVLDLAALPREQVGPYLLLGNPNQPDGLHLMRVEDLPALAQLAAAQARAGPAAA